MTFLRRILPKSWHVVIDYDPHEDIDFRDDWQEQPREPKGTPEGGQFASTGVVGGGGTPIPTPGTAHLAQKGGKGSAQKIAAAVAAHLSSGTPLEDIKGKLHAFGQSSTYSGYASYANQLLKHVEQAQGLQPGSLGKAMPKAKQAAVEMATEAVAAGAPPVEAAVEAAAPAATPAAPAAKSAVHEHMEWAVNHGGMQPDEKLSWIQALKGDLAPDDTEGQMFASMWEHKLQQETHPKVEPQAQPKAEPAQPQPEKIDMGVPQPQTKSQASVYAIFTDPDLSHSVKISKIKEKIPGYGHAPNKEYAEKALASLGYEGETEPDDYQMGGKEPPAKPSLSGIAGQDIDYIEKMAAADDSTKAEKTEAIKNIANDHPMNSAVGKYATAQIAHLEGIDPGDPEFEKLHPRGPDGKFLMGAQKPTKPEATSAAEAIAAAKTGTIPEPLGFLAKSQAVKNIYLSATGNTGSKAKHIENYLQAKINTGEIKTGSAEHGYAKAVIQAMQAQEGAAMMAAAGPPKPPVPIHAVHAILTDPAMHHQEKIDTLHALKKSAETQGIGVAEVKKGLDQLEDDFGKTLPMPDGTPAQQELWEVAATSMYPTDIKLKQLGVEAEGQNAATQAYAKKLEAMIKGEPAEMPQPPPANLPAPKPGSTTQTKMHEIAAYVPEPTSAMTNPKKIEGIKEILLNTPSAQPGGTAEAYANQLIEALGGEKVDKAALEAAAAPTPTAAPGTAGKTPIPTQAQTLAQHKAGVSQTPNQLTLARGKKHEKQAIKVTNAASPDAAKACATLDRKWWSKVDPEAREACTSYKGGSNSINSALRETGGIGGGTVSKGIQRQIDLIDDLFEHPDAKLKEDMIIRRGEDAKHFDVQKAIASLTAGKIVRETRMGFTSASAASKPPGGWSGNAIQWEITARAGTPVLGLWAADKSFEHENEVILRHNQGVDIYEIEKKGTQWIIRGYTV